MSDDIDRMLQGEDTPSASQAQTLGQQDDSIQRIEQQTEEEIEFNKLSGSAQERVKELVRRAKEAEMRASQQAPSYVPQAPGSNLLPDQKQAIDTLRNFGITTKDDVKEEVNQGLNQIKWELKNQTLESKYSGSDGTPKYDREEVEDYMRSHPQYQYYDPEDVFKYKMFPDEFSAAGTQQAPSRQKTSSLKPVKGNPQVNAFSDIDTLQRRLAEPDGDEYYEAHKDEINRAVAEHTQKFKGTNFGGQ